MFNPFQRWPTKIYTLMKNNWFYQTVSKQEISKFHSKSNSTPFNISTQILKIPKKNRFTKLQSHKQMVTNRRKIDL